MYTPQPIREGFLPEVDGHRVHFTCYGTSDGPTIVSCHGGPGGRSKAKHAGVFDLTQYHVVCIDQRGCGKSEPVGETTNNTIADLVQDMERVREEIGVAEWFVSGSSWGSTVALVYAEQYSERVRGLLLSSVFLADPASDAWAFRDPNGVARLFADGWDVLQGRLQDLGIALSDDVPSALLREITSEDLERRQTAAAVVASWEVNLLSRTIPVQYKRAEEIDEEAIASATVFLHYQAHRYWLEPDQIHTQIATIKDTPAVLVHGRYDILCPFSEAWKLHQAMPNSTCIALPESHHILSGDGAVAREYAFRYFLDRCAER